MKKKIILIILKSKIFKFSFYIFVFSSIYFLLDVFHLFDLLILLAENIIENALRWMLLLEVEEKILKNESQGVTCWIEWTVFLFVLLILLRSEVWFEYFWLKIRLFWIRYSRVVYFLGGILVSYIFYG